ncbi:serpin family protein [Patescibacteria group bacterium]|nr:serpin family protein [Patescibacteria group bacterium]
MKQKILTVGITALIVIVFGGLLSGCTLQPPLTPSGDNVVITEGLDNVVDANNRFALDLYSKYKSEEGNVFFSPYSISTALAMTYEGARGQTAQEMQSVFYFPEDNDIRRGGYAGLYSEINKKDKKYKLHTANALWAEQDFQFLDEYFSLVGQYYNGEVTNLNFKQDAEKSRIIINTWVEDQTNNKIKDLIPKGVIDYLTRLVLTNAVYFKGEWVKQFNKDDTTAQDFKITPDNIVKVPIMRRADDKAIFNYSENDELQILGLPYSGEDLSMLVLLPKNNDLTSLENSLSIEKLSEWKKDLKEQRVNIYIPKFKFETKYLMADTLKEMGMPIAFSSAADFSGMTGKKDLFISNVIHQAFVDVNEEGTEAAAATAVVMKLTSTGIPEPTIPTFRADHPFIFIIQQNDTGNILFMGKVVDPR